MGGVQHKATNLFKLNIMSLYKKSIPAMVEQEHCYSCLESQYKPDDNESVCACVCGGMYNTMHSVYGFNHNALI